MLVAMLAAFSAPALAQTKECNEEFKSATYQKWYDNRKEHQDVAYQAAKEYLATCTTEDQYSTALKKFATAYEAMTANATSGKEFEDAFKNKKFAEQIRLGKVVLANDPDNTAVYIIMGVAGLGDPALLAESAQYAKKAIELIEAGKPFAPAGSKDQALASLNYVIGKANLKNAPADAIPYLLKAARFESDLKKNPQLYAELAAAYAEGPVAKLTDNYKVFVGKDETPESKLVLANLNQVIDRQIDALARAAALSTNAADKKAVMDQLSELYKYRNKSDTGLNELVAGILSKPLPDIPTPLTSLPTPTPTPANTGSQSGMTGSAQPATSGATKPASNTTSTSGQNKTTSTTGTGTQPGKTQTGTKTSGGAKPAASPTPKPRRNHRRG